MNKRSKTYFSLVLGIAALALIFTGPGSAQASALVPQTPYPGVFVEKWANPLAIFGAVDLGAGPIDVRATGASQTVNYVEFRQRILPPSFYATLSAVYPSYDGTLLWGYDILGDGLGLSSGSSDPGRQTGFLFPGNTIIAQRGTPTEVTYANELPAGIVDANPNYPYPTASNEPNYLQRLLSIDQTLHFANPFEIDITNPEQTGGPYLGPQPVTPHLHGGAVFSGVDGGPEQWFTPLIDPGATGLPQALHGAAYYSEGTPAPNEVIYTYPNGQEASTLWFHDHALGMTRINVYAGLAAYYWLRDPGTIDDGSGVAGKLPAGPYEFEFVIQDRMFDTTGELLFPDGLPFFMPQPPHLFWNPEFFGDVIVVNGQAWPFANVDPRRYRVRLLNGSNARFYHLSLKQAGKGKKVPPAWYVIGTDGGMLNDPVPISDLLIAPGERYDTIIDFSNAAGKTFTMINDAKAPYPFGASADPQTVGQIAQFVVSATPVADGSFNVAAAVTDGDPNTLRPGNAIVGLPGATFLGGPAISTANVQRVRQLTLNENLGAFGPIEALVNNTKWNGRINGPGGAGLAVSPGVRNILTLNGGTNSAPVEDFLTELPEVGSTEIWQIINMTGDAHPIHLHLVQFQVLSRQNYNTRQYDAAYILPWGSPAIPKGIYQPAFGPPLPYNDNQNPDPTGIPIIGGNPDVSPYLQGRPKLPEPYEMGWKDTVVVPPKQVTTIVVRWAPQEYALGDVSPSDDVYSTDLNYDFVATDGPGYVWHCHIIDHEDNEMMRPYHLDTDGDNVRIINFP